MKDPITIGEKYRPAMVITDQAEADSYFEECVQHCMRYGKTRLEAEKIEKINLRYFAGYYDNETRERVEKLFHCEHPFFGAIEKNVPPSDDEVFKIGMREGMKN